MLAFVNVPTPPKTGLPNIDNSSSWTWTPRWQVGNRLHPAAGQVQIGDGRRGEDTEGVQPLWGHVDVAVRGQRGRGHEENMLPLDERTQVVVQGGVDLAHVNSSPPICVAVETALGMVEMEIVDVLSAPGKIYPISEEQFIRFGSILDVNTSSLLIRKTFDNNGFAM